MSHAKYPKVVGYTITEQIGGGGFSRVYRATHFEKERSAAVKLVLLTEKTTDVERQTLEREMRIHQALKCANVIEFMDAVIVDNKGPQKITYVPGVYMLLELAGAGDLFDKIAPDVGIESDMAHFYFIQLCQGVQYIHSQGVVHRDLKPENILLDSSGTLKISDFGLASVYMLKETGKSRLLSDVCGSLPYVAPELNSQKPYKGPPIDVWGLGVILFTMLVGNTPWDEPTTRSPEYREYVSGNIVHHAPWDRLPGSELSLIKGLLAVDPAKRMTLDQVFAHPWIARSSQVGKRGLAQLAEQLTQNLRATGDLDIAHPPEAAEEADDEGDVTMIAPVGHLSQFTQSLLLFSQTQGGTRHTPQLTRFYASVTPAKLLAPLQSALTTHAVKHKTVDLGGEDGGSMPSGSLRLQIAAYDARKELLKGWIDLEPAARAGTGGKATEGGRAMTLCVMRRDSGNPLSWRKLWKLVALDKDLEPFVLRKRS